MIRRASCGSRFGALEAEHCQIEFIDEGVDKADRIIFQEVVVEALGKEDHLVPVRALDMTHNPRLRERGLQ